MITGTRMDQHTFGNLLFLTSIEKKSGKAQTRTRDNKHASSHHQKATKTMPKTGRESNSHKPNDNQARGALDNLEMTKEKDTGISNLKWPAKTRNMPPEQRKLKN